MAERNHGSGTLVPVSYATLAAAFRFPADDGGAITRAEHLLAFDRSVSAGASSLYERTYSQADTSGLFEELVRYYEYFGLVRAPDAELPDHVSVELEFMHFLSELERHAAARGDDVGSVCRSAREFIDRHLNCLLLGLQADRRGKPEREAWALVEAGVEFVAQHRAALAAATVARMS